MRPCVSVTVSEFGIILRNYTDFRENKKPNILVQFLYRPSLSTGVSFRKFSDFLEYFETIKATFCQNTYIPKTHSKPSQHAQGPRKTAFCVFDHFLCMTDVAYKRCPSYTFCPKTFHTFKKRIQNRPSTLRGREKQLFVFLTIFCV